MYSTESTEEEAIISIKIVVTRVHTLVNIYQMSCDNCKIFLESNKAKSQLLILTTTY